MAQRQDRREATVPVSTPSPTSGIKATTATIALLSVLVVALSVALIASLATRPSTTSATIDTATAPALSPQQATKNTCDSFAAARAGVIAAGAQYRPVSWSFTDPHVDTWVKAYTAAADQAANSVHITPGTSPTVRAAVSEWVNTELMASQAMLIHDGRSLDNVDARTGAAEIASRQACGLQ